MAAWGACAPLCAFVAHARDKNVRDSATADAVLHFFAYDIRKDNIRAHFHHRIRIQAQHLAQAPGLAQGPAPPMAL